MRILLLLSFAGLAVSVPAIAANPPTAEGATAKPVAAGGTHPNQAAFRAAQAFDVDRNQLIDGGELQKFNAAYADDTEGPLAFFDKNRDGKVDETEIGRVNKRLAAAAARAEKRAQQPAKATKKAPQAGAATGRKTPKAAAAASRPEPIPAADIGTGTATLSWQPPTQNADGTPLKNLAGYVVRFGRAPEKLNRRVVVEDPKATSYVVGELGKGKWYFSVAAVTSMGAESAAGPVVSKTIE